MSSGIRSGIRISGSGRVINASESRRNPSQAHPKTPSPTVSPIQSGTASPVGSTHNVSAFASVPGATGSPPPSEPTLTSTPARHQATGEEFRPSDTSMTWDHMADVQSPGQEPLSKELPSGRLGSGTTSPAQPAPQEGTSAPGPDATSPARPASEQGLPAPGSGAAFPAQPAPQEGTSAPGSGAISPSLPGSEQGSPTASPTPPVSEKDPTGISGGQIAAWVATTLLAATIVVGVFASLGAIPGMSSLAGRLTTIFAGTAFLTITYFALRSCCATLRQCQPNPV